VSLKGRLRGLDAGVRWLETEGSFRRIRNMVRIQEMAQKFADRVAADPAHAAKVKKEDPFFFAYMSWLSAGLRPPAPPPPPEPEAAPPVLPILRDAAEPAAPQDEAVQVQTKPHPEERCVAARQGAFERSRSKHPEGCEPARSPPDPMPGQPVAPPSPAMQIRPVQWRPREAQDYYEEEDVPGTNGHCITEYDPLRDEYDDST
jgi:hypothetical protein